MLSRFEDGSWGGHGEIVMESDGSEGTERKTGPEDDVQRTCHFSTKSRSTRLSLITYSGPKNSKTQEALCYDETSQHEAFLYPFVLATTQLLRTKSRRKSRNYRDSGNMRTIP